VYKITKHLWVADIEQTAHGDTGRFDAVLSVCQDEVSDNTNGPYHHFKLSDGPPSGRSGGRFEYTLFRDAANMLAAYLEDRHHVLVHCHAGQSRSPAVAAAALTRAEDMDAKEAIETVQDALPQTHMHPKFYGWIRRYANGDR
jgi:hypothetical protein